MIVIGIDPHKSTHTATAVDPATNRDLGSVRIRSPLDDYAQLITWPKQWPDRIWAVENASGLGHHLTQWLIGRGEAVVDVPPTATARVRELSRGGDRVLNSAIHIVAVTQARMPNSDGYTYHRRKMAEGKNSHEAMFCLKRQVAKRLWRTMRDDHTVRMAVYTAA